MGSEKTFRDVYAERGQRIIDLEAQRERIEALALAWETGSGIHGKHVDRARQLRRALSAPAPESHEHRVDRVLADFDELTEGGGEHDLVLGKPASPPATYAECMATARRCREEIDAMPEPQSSIMRGQVPPHGDAPTPPDADVPDGFVVTHLRALLLQHAPQPTSTPSPDVALPAGWSVHPGDDFVGYEKDGKRKVTVFSDGDTYAPDDCTCTLKAAELHAVLAYHLAQQPQAAPPPPKEPTEDRTKPPPGWYADDTGSPGDPTFCNRPERYMVPLREAWEAYDAEHPRQPDPLVTELLAAWDAHKPGDYARLACAIEALRRAAKAGGK